MLISDLRHLDRTRPGATRWQVGWFEIFHCTTGLNLIQKHNLTIFGKRKLKIFPTLGHSRPDSCHYNYFQHWNGFRGNHIFNIKSINTEWPSVFAKIKYNTKKIQTMQRDVYQESKLYWKNASAQDFRWSHHSSWPWPGIPCPASPVSPCIQMTERKNILSVISVQRSESYLISGRKVTSPHAY